MDLNLKFEKESKYLRAILENVSDGIVACNEQGVLSFFNDATRNFHGLPEVAIPAEEWANHYHLYYPDEKTVMAKEDIPLFKAYRGETVKDIEMLIAPVNGNKRKLLATGRQIISSEGKNMGAVVVMHDVTNQKENNLLS
jgi:PAS domain S-box-containing protein